MKYLWIFCILFLTGLSVAKADKAVETEADETSIYYTKYGQKGLDQINYFYKAKANKEMPFATNKGEYKSVYTKPEDMELFKVKPIDIPMPVNSECIKGDEISLENQTTDEYYYLKDGEKPHLIRVEKIICTGDLYNFKEKGLRLQYDGDVFSILHFYRDGKKLFDVPGADEYAIYNTDFIVNVSDGCCNLGGYFNHYNWVTGNVIATEQLETSLDDAPSVDIKAEDVILPNGERLTDFQKKIDASEADKTKTGGGL